MEVNVTEVFLKKKKKKNLEEIATEILVKTKSLKKGKKKKILKTVF